MYMLAYQVVGNEKVKHGCIIQYNDTKLLRLLSAISNLQ